METPGAPEDWAYLVIYATTVVNFYNPIMPEYRITIQYDWMIELQTRHWIFVNNIMMADIEILQESLKSTFSDNLM